MDLEDAGKSFLKHMKGKDRQSLVNYANLVYAGLAAIPGLVADRAEFKADLLPYVSKCGVCGTPVNPKPSDCVACANLFVDVRVRTVEALIRHRDTTFYCLELEPRKMRKGQAEEDAA